MDVRSAPKRATAYHEAGHGVGHHFFPLSGRTKSITIEAARLSEYNAGKHEVNKAAGLHFGSKTLSPIVGRSVDRDHVHHQIMALLAGPAADYLYAGDSKKRRKPSKAQIEEALRHDDGGDDHTRALRLLYDADPFDARDVVRQIPDQDRQRLSPEELMERYGAPAAQAESDRVLAEMARYYREALEFVASKWPHVQGLADAVFKKKTLDGDEVIAVIERVEARLCDGPPPELWRPEP